jgi:hypothetical protein
MKRPEKYEHPEIYPNCYVYKCTDIDPLLDRLQELEAEQEYKVAENLFESKPLFPSLQPFSSEIYNVLLVNILRCLDKQQKANLCFDLYCRSEMTENIDSKIRELKMEQIKADKKPFPSLDEFKKWYQNGYFNVSELDIYNYFSQFQYEKTVFPKVGDMIEGEDKYVEGVYRKGELDSFYIIVHAEEEVFEIKNIRPVSTRPTPEEVIAQVESKLKSNELTFDRELVEQFLNILKGE